MGKNIYYLPSCRSTNDFAADLLTNQTPMEGTAVITSSQTSGRGQRGNGWESEPHQNLTFSLILYPSFILPIQQFELTMVVSVAIVKALATWISNELTIKWPNDIYVGNQKIAGILIENQIQGQQMSASVVGIGLNVNQKVFQAPLATSLCNIVGKTFELNTVFERVLLSIEEYYELWKVQGNRTIKSRYLNSLYRYQEWHSYRDLRFTDSSQDHPVFTGQILGIDHIGRLAIQTNDTISYFAMKEIEFVSQPL